MAGKRKANADKEEPSGKRGVELSEEDDGYSTSSSYAPSAIDVSFNYVAPTEIDFMALKRLVQQLYHTHADQVDLGALADHIIHTGDVEKRGDKALGTVVKVEDDEDGDPFAFVSALPLSASGGVAGQTLLQYYEKVCGGASSTGNAGAKAIDTILRQANGSAGGVLQIFHERMINLPPQIMPPLYRMLFDELKAAAELNSAQHLLFFSRVFSMDSLSDEEEGEEGKDGASAQSRARKSKKTKRSKPIQNQAISKVASANVDAAGEANEMGLFHPEDSILARYATHTFTFAFPAVKDSDGSFNAPMYGRLAVLKNDRKQIQALLDELTDAFAVAA